MAEKFTVDRALVQGMTKKERARFVREARRAERERLARVRRRRRIAWWTAGGLVVVAAGGIATHAVVQSAQERAAAEAEAAANAGPANMITDGLQWVSADDSTSMSYTATEALADGDEPTTNASTVSATGVLDIQVYLDPTSTDAATFWSATSDTLQAYVVAGYVSVELHPFALDTSNTDAVAAVAAFGCVADAEADSAFALWDAIMQYGIDGADAGTAVTAADLADAASTAGVTTSEAIDCIDSGGFTPWATAASERAAASVPYASDGAGVTSGALVIAAGSVYTGDLSDADAFATFLNDAYTTATSG
ncbi:MAG: thioredoxin domain-containing protein [Microbacterium sp.]